VYSDSGIFMYLSLVFLPPTVWLGAFFYFLTQGGAALAAAGALAATGGAAPLDL
jgi:hypothetical protein